MYAPARLESSQIVWGVSEALDVLQLEHNEGLGYQGDLRLLFSACTDPRSAIRTLAMLPPDYRGAVTVVMNDDKTPNVSARNVILLLMALIVEWAPESADEIVDCMIHVWYSALIRQKDLQVLQYVRASIEYVWNGVEEEAPDESLDEFPSRQWHWRTGSKQLQVTLRKSAWLEVLTLLDIPADLTAEKALDIRAEAMRDPVEANTRNAYMRLLTPSRRLALHRFELDGILLPFGSCRKDFDTPNPTLFRNGVWSVRTDIHPLYSWNSQEVADTSTLGATEDVFGKLFYYLRKLLKSFVLRMLDVDVCFRLYNFDVEDVHRLLLSNEETFSRIDMGNVADEMKLGIRKTLGLAVAVLQKRDENRHATIITLFTAAVRGADWAQDILASQGPRVQSFVHLARNMAIPFAFDHRIDEPDMALSVLGDYDRHFDRYTEDQDRPFYKYETAFRVCMKEEHTIVEKWPHSSAKLQADERGATTEFERLLSRSWSSRYRYVEWEWEFQGQVMSPAFSS
ncbi:hypothetical protein QBC34DRAFT_404108 [Podospora aff. communis PSN243]|uniref:DUF4470 domain-containing protein n=1 Tax=Podospora aff. communis PSN243 TaxID=3040156 RepID=A0AAV9GTD8_9PEZI|nr:hypothetical protein QBC34DRAFT_404108 [Podospora aff. communis PSN243]